jgi:hypothetical protein
MKSLKKAPHEKSHELLEESYCEWAIKRLSIMIFNSNDPKMIL